MSGAYGHRHAVGAARNCAFWVVASGAVPALREWRWRIALRWHKPSDAVGAGSGLLGCRRPGGSFHGWGSATRQPTVVISVSIVFQKGTELRAARLRTSA